TVDLAWEIIEKYNGYIVYGNLSNLPAGIINPGFKVNTHISTHELTDIKDVPYLNLIAANGANLQQLGLPEQMMLTLYNGSVVRIPVAWELDTVNYDPEISTPQTFSVYGQFNNLPAGVTNSRMTRPFAYVQVAASLN